MRQWVTQSGIPPKYMPNFFYVYLRSSQILLASWNVLCTKSLFSLLLCLALKFNDWFSLYSLKFYDKSDN